MKSPRGRVPLSSGQRSPTKTLFYGIVAAILLWFAFMPLYLVKEFNIVFPAPSVSEMTAQSVPQLQSHSKGGAPIRLPDFGAQDDNPPTIQVPNPAPIVIKPSTETSGMWKLSSLPSSELNQLDWYKKGRLLVENNADYLKAASKRAVDPTSTITLVSGLFDLGRGDLKNSFSRSFDYYVQRFAVFLRYKFPKIIYIQPEHYHLYKPYIDSSPGPVYVINKTLDEIRSAPYYDLVQQIRTKPGWAQQAGWLADSPQATMPLYNPMVMSKILWSRDAAQLNPFETDSFLWFDGGHLCNDPNGLTPENSEVFHRHFDKLLITFFEYEPWGEVHGFEDDAFREYIDNQKDAIVLVGRGGVFGGTKEFLEVASEVYMLALMDTLSAGYMGTEENIFSILYYRFPELVHAYENGMGGNCAIWYEAFHKQPPTPIYHPKIVLVENGIDLRGAKCVGRNDDISCSTNGALCPAFVNPLWLDEAAQQWSCKDKTRYCTVECSGANSESVRWFAHNCPKRGVCPPHGTVSWEDFYDVDPRPSPSPAPKKKPEPSPSPTPAPVQQETFTQFEIDFMKMERKKYPASTRDHIKKHGYDLRGLKCEILENKQVCFAEFRSGRDTCPEWVTAEYLTLAHDQWSCQPGRETYCLARCQEGTDRIQWMAYNKEWCSDPANSHHCAPRPPIIPYDELFLHEWSLPPRQPKSCDFRPISDFSRLKPFSVGVLARGNELESLTLSVQTWEQRGFLQFADEFIFMINEASTEVLKFVADYTEPPYNAKVMFSNDNEGILNGINWLLGNSTNEYLLFLEKDFRLVESLPCALEQIEAGLELLETKKAEVIKYRSRYNAGRPNWAEILYRDHEDDVFDSQPNLLCNFYHWVDKPEQRWPKHFELCHEDPEMYCVDAEFCNWTNNPFLISKYWWFENYVNKFVEFRTSTADFNLETFMNWAPNAWNNRGWTIAEGDGMFKHADTRNFGG